ncbi:MAG: hypothetical protein M0Z99_35240 [Betaproteobacteria bacterium]|nr:hypothetical protein [Betaproteobacteria bacterium]
MHERLLEGVTWQETAGLAAVARMNLEGGAGWRLPSYHQPIRAGWAWASYLSKDAVDMG